MMNSPFRWLFIAFFLFATGKLFSQMPEQDCIAAIPVCQDTFVQSIPYLGVGADTNEISGNTCLLVGEQNSVWYTFTVQVSGNLCFSIVPVDLNDDYDWAVFNLTSASCDDIYSNSSLKVECSYSSNTGVTGANGLPGGSQNRPCIPVLAGEKYVIEVNRFSNNTTGYTLDFSASTAQLYDIIPPELLSVTTPVFCGDSQIVLTFAEKVFCSTVQPSDFILKGPSGNISISNVSSSNCVASSSYSNQFILTLAPAVFPVGNFSLILLANAGVQDLCNNPNANSDTVFFTVTPFPLSVSTTPQLCSSNNGTATAVNNGGVSPFSFSWNTPISQNTVTATGLTPGVYTVTVTDNVGCVSTASGNVGFDPGINPPVASIGSFSSATCSGLNDGSATVNVTGGTPPFAYIWNTSPVQVSSSATGLGTGMAICTVTDSNGCSDTASINITGGVPVFITAIPNDTSICKGSSAYLSASVLGGTNPYTFTWLFNGSVDGTNIPHQVNPSVTSDYLVFATDNAGCKSDTAIITVTVLPPISVSVISSSNIVCSGQSLELTALANGGKGSGYSYIWSNTNDTGRIINVSPASNTTFFVTVSDNCTNPAGIGSIDVTVGQAPPTMDIKGGPLTGCVPLDVLFYVEPYIPGYIFMWDFGDGNLKNTTLDTVYNSYGLEGCKDVSLIIITNEGCRDTIIDNCIVNTLPSPTAGFNFTPSNPSTISPVITFLDQSSGAVSWQWNLGDNSISNDKNFQHEYPDSGAYPVKLVVSNEFNCTDTIEQLINIGFESTFYIPNTFTPNEDEINDVFIPVFEGVKPENYNFYIFDRWGNIVFHTDKLNTPWDGKVNGNYPQDGLYMYYIKYQKLTGEESKIRGSVTLIK